jgi:hypothetical protein
MVPRVRGLSAGGGSATGLGKATDFHIVKDMIKMGEMQVFYEGCAASFS